MTAATFACKLQYPDMQSAVEADLSQLGVLLVAAAPLQPRDRHHRDRQGARRAAARGTRLPARGAEHAALRHRASRRAAGQRAGAGGRPLDPPPPHHDLARRQAADLLPRPQPRGPQPHRHRPVPRVVGARSRATASSMATRISATTPCSRAAAKNGGKPAPAGINLLDFGCIRIFTPDLRRRRGRPLPRLPQRRPRPDRARLRALGLSGPHQRDHRHPQHLGALHLRAAARRPGADHRRRRQAAGVWPAARCGR